MKSVKTLDRSRFLISEKVLSVGKLWSQYSGNPAKLICINHLVKCETGTGAYYSDELNKNIKSKRPGLSKKKVPGIMGLFIKEQ